MAPATSPWPPATSALSHPDIRSKLLEWVGLFAEAEPWEQGLELMFERRLGRKLAGPEREALSTSFTKLGRDRLGDVVLNLSPEEPEELKAWLEDPNAK